MNLMKEGALQGLFLFNFLPTFVVKKWPLPTFIFDQAFLAWLEDSASAHFFGHLPTFI